ncbi:MAG: 30S ribosomal protein S12 methylthiotransferase RimO, partial [Firmicutes bacterium]|nr:30S ribosomal protein S12 methylthiotransferase RimO [Bacillota bacterium]
INTCAFIEDARQESIDTILSLAKFKQSGKCQKLIVTGCLPQKYASELKKELPEVDAFLGTKDYASILNIINDLFDQKSLPVKTKPHDNRLKKRVLTTPAHYAYLMIADGCDNHCAYCTIPSIRGQYVSQSIDNLVEEAKVLVDGGVKEIILVAQDVTNYGVDLYGKRQLVALLKQLSTQTNVKWIRLMYCYPQNIDDELINEIKTNDKIVKYIDMPLQHIDQTILSGMGRKGSELYIKDLIKKIKDRINGIAIRTTFMVGFPNEDEAEFNNLLNFLEKEKFTHAGFFVFSPEEGTPAAKMKSIVKKTKAKQRQKLLAAAQQKNVMSFNKNLVGKTIKVIYDDIDFDKNMFVGRAYFSAPQIDTVVYFKSDTLVEVGQFYDVLVVGTRGYDLIGKVCG